MIQKFIDRFIAKKEFLEAKFREARIEEYKELIKIVITTISDENDYESPDSERITEIDHGDYQGTLVFVIAANNYQPSTYWYVKISYGSCSGCDTLQDINGYSNNPPTDSQIADYMTLALHIVQQIKEMSDGM